MWFKEFNWCFYKTENFADGEINERSFSNPPLKSVVVVSIICSMQGYQQQHAGLFPQDNEMALDFHFLYYVLIIKNFKRLPTGKRQFSGKLIKLMKRRWSWFQSLQICNTIRIFSSFFTVNSRVPGKSDSRFKNIISNASELKYLKHSQYWNVILRELLTTKPTLFHWVDDGLMACRKTRHYLSQPLSSSLPRYWVTCQWVKAPLFSMANIWPRSGHIALR